MKYDSHVTDGDLMIKIAAGDKQAFRQLMQRHLSAVLNFNKQYLPQDAEDITQEAFIRLWNKAEKWQDKGISPKAWLLRVSYNLSIDELRKRKMVSLEEQEIDLVDSSKTDEQLLLAQAEMQQLKLALKELPERQRTALSLSAYSNLSNKDTAAVLGISVNALESLLTRARRALKQILARRG